MSIANKSLSSFALVLLVTGQLLPQIDFSVVNVALDVIGQTLKIQESGLVLIVALYGLSFAAFIATGARLGDRYGRKRMFMLGTIGFCIASTLCGAATHLITMLVGRLLQGICAALLLPQILATIHATLSGERHSRAVGIYASAAGLSVALGQGFGGWVVSANFFDLGWRLAFFINIPVCLLILGIGAFIIPETYADKQPQMDVLGIVLFILLLLCVLLPVAMGPHWPTLYWLLLGVLPAAYSLWRVERNKEVLHGQPLLPPSLFKTPSMVLGLIGELSVTMSYSGYLFISAFFLQNVIHFSPLQSGNTFMVLGLMFFIGSLLSRIIEQRLGNYINFVTGSALSLLGFVITLALFWMFGQQQHTVYLMAATGMVGLGNAFMITSSFRIVLSRVQQRHSGEASSMVSTLQQGCFAIGTAISGAIYMAVSPHGVLPAISASIGTFCVVLLVIGSLIFCKRPKNPLLLSDPEYS